MFSSSEQVAARSYCSWLGNTLCSCSPVLPAQAVPESGPKSLAIDFAAKTFDYLLEHPSERLQDNRQAFKASNLDSKPPDQRVVKLSLPPKSHYKLCGVWILFKSVTDAKFEPSEVTFCHAPHWHELCHQEKNLATTGVLRKTHIQCWSYCASSSEPHRTLFPGILLSSSLPHKHKVSWVYFNADPHSNTIWWVLCLIKHRIFQVLQQVKLAQIIVPGNAQK